MANLLRLQSGHIIPIQGQSFIPQFVVKTTSELIVIEPHPPVDASFVIKSHHTLSMNWLWFPADSKKADPVVVSIHNNLYTIEGPDTLLNSLPQLAALADSKSKADRQMHDEVVEHATKLMQYYRKLQVVNSTGAPQQPTEAAPVFSAETPPSLAPAPVGEEPDWTKRIEARTRKLRKVLDAANLLVEAESEPLEGYMQLHAWLMENQLHIPDDITNQIRQLSPIDQVIS